MKIAIFSDSHDNLANLKRAISLIENEKIKIILHCGDVASFGTLKEILENFSGKIYLSLGNMDKDYFLDKKSLKNSKRLKIMKNFGEIERDQKRIAFTHFPEIAQGLAQSQKYDFVFYGHSHRPWLEKIGKTKLVNPGNISGLDFKASFAICDLKNEKLELKILK